MGVVVFRSFLREKFTFLKTPTHIEDIYIFCPQYVTLYVDLWIFYAETNLIYLNILDGALIKSRLKHVIYYLKKARTIVAFKRHVFGMAL